MRPFGLSLFLLLLLALAAAASSPTRVPRNLATVRSIYNLNVYPNNLGIHTNGSAAIPPGLFSANATGRISPVGNFTGFNDSVEYFFALSPVPAASNGNLALWKADVIDYTSGCDEVAASVVYLYGGKVDLKTGKPVKNSPTTILKQIAFWRFDDTGAVVQYEAWIPNTAKWVALTSGTPVKHARSVAELCGAIQGVCKGSNQEYASVDECESVLDGKEFGDWDEVWGDNVVCRMIHVILATLRPEVHCPHVGPRGGNGPDNWKCTDIDYRIEYFDDALLYGRTEDVFACPGDY